MNAATRPLSAKKSYLPLLGYIVVVLILWAGWALRDQRYIVASDGLGYWLGLVGATLMLLLLLYPLRKRSRLLRNAGPIRHWFRIHMIFGIVGPMFVLLHSNFSFGSLNSRVALISTLVVSISGVAGRYLYAKIHNGMYGQRITMETLQAQIAEVQVSGASIASLLPMINARLGSIDESLQRQDTGLLKSFSQAISLTIKLLFTKRKLKRQVRTHLKQLAQDSAVVAENRKRLQRSAYGYLEHRTSVLRKFAQLQAAERLFSLWHIVHYPLFLILVVAAVVHVVAVHMY